MRSYDLPNLLAILATAGVVCYWLARYLSRPVVKLRAATRELAEGNLAARVGSTIGTRRDEVAELSRDFDRMAERIESLVSSQRRLVRDIAHELRSPLARLHVALELARRDIGLKRENNLKRIEIEANRLNELIQQLLDLARLEGGADELELEPVDLTAVVRQVVEDETLEAEAKQIQLEVKLTEPCIIEGSSKMLRSALENVVRNAIYYTPGNSVVQVSLNCAGGDAKIVVRDQGPGVPNDDLEEIFSAFFRVAEARDRVTGGTGLGLSITQRIIRKHDGSVHAENHPEGGLVLTIRLPLARSSLE